MGVFRPLNKFWITLNGLSMSPLLKDQDEIHIAPVKSEELKIGDVLLFFDQHDRALTLHRLIELPMKTKGDFSLYAEENSVDSCLGKAIGFSRDQFYRELPGNNSLFTSWYLFMSKLRMKGGYRSKVAHLLLLISAKVFELCSAKTMSDHSEEQRVADLL